MKIRVHGLTEQELVEQAPDLLMKAAQAMNVVLVEKEPTFDDKSYLPHTVKLVAQLEDWFYQKFSLALEGLKQELIRNVSGKQLESKGVVNRAEIVEKKNFDTTPTTLAKSELALIHLKNLLMNPGVNKRTRVSIYNRAKQIMDITPPNKRQELINIFLEIKDLV